MNIVSTQYNINNQSLEIYIAGCNANPKCKNCHNPELWNYDIGTPYIDWFNVIQNKINEFPTIINKIMIFGGEPLDQDINELKILLQFLQTLDKEIWLFTRYEFDEIQESIIKLCHYIKCGKYIPELKTDTNIQYGIKLATSNQQIYKIGGRL
jgi:anaerobic ribonucleoside-triphosphate reductase activating protein